jgi:hypothetical protein
LPAAAAAAKVGKNGKPQSARKAENKKEAKRNAAGRNQGDKGGV